MIPQGTSMFPQQPRTDINSAFQQAMQIVGNQQTQTTRQKLERQSLIQSKAEQTALGRLLNGDINGAIQTFEDAGVPFSENAINSINKTREYQHAKEMQAPLLASREEIAQAGIQGRQAGWQARGEQQTALETQRQTGKKEIQETDIEAEKTAQDVELKAKARQSELERGGRLELQQRNFNNANLLKADEQHWKELNPDSDEARIVNRAAKGLDLTPEDQVKLDNYGVKQPKEDKGPENRRKELIHLYETIIKTSESGSDAQKTAMVEWQKLISTPLTPQVTSPKSVMITPEEKAKNQAIADRIMEFRNKGSSDKFIADQLREKGINPIDFGIEE